MRDRILEAIDQKLAHFAVYRTVLRIKAQTHDGCLIKMAQHLGLTVDPVELRDALALRGIFPEQLGDKWSLIFCEPRKPERVA